MSDPLLTTKLYLPYPRAGQRLVPRPHLVARLNEALSDRLTLVSSPAGFGNQAELFGLLLKFHDLNFTVLAVHPCLTQGG